MHAAVDSAVLQCVDAIGCRVEARVSGTGRDVVRIVGLPDAAVRESVQRVESAVAASGFTFPGGRVSRTIADLDGSSSVQEQHAAEAVQYRMLDLQRC